jgi:hypothetical protein
MTEQQRLGATALANSRREAIRRRTRRIRRSVAAMSAVLFVSMFLVIYVQLASGHDPALTARSRRASTAATNAASSSASGTSASSGTSESQAGSTAAGTEASSESTGGTGEETSSSPSPVTTSQS